MGSLSETYDRLVCSRVRVSQTYRTPHLHLYSQGVLPGGPYREKCYILNGAFFMSALFVRLSVEVDLRISFALVIKDPRIV